MDAQGSMDNPIRRFRLRRAWDLLTEGVSLRRAAPTPEPNAIPAPIVVSVSISRPSLPYGEDYLAGVGDLFDTPEETVLKQLAKEIEENKGEWRTGLRSLVESELDILLDSDCYTQEKVWQAVEQIAIGNLEEFTEHEDLLKDFVTLQELLILQHESTIYNSLIQRDKKQNKKLPTLEHIKYETLDILEKKMSLIISSNVKYQIIKRDKPFFIRHKKYLYDEFLGYLKNIIAPYGIKLQYQPQIDIFEHALLQWSQINEFPDHCNTHHGYAAEDRMVFSEGHFHITLSLLQHNIRKFMRFLEHHLGDNAAELIKTINTDHTIRLNTNHVIKAILSGEFHDFLITLLINPDIVKNYQLLSDKKNISLNIIIYYFNDMVGKKHKVNVQSDFIETCMVYAWGVGEELNAAEFRKSNRFDSFITHMDFYLGISINAAHRLATAINADFPGAAKLVLTDVYLAHKGDIKLQVVSIKNEVLIKKDFLIKLSDSLDYIADHDPDLLEVFQMASSSRVHTTRYLADKLTDLADDFKNTEKLSSSLKKLSIFSAERKPLIEIQKASFELSQSISAYEAQCATREEHAFFKQGKKQEIKEIQREIISQKSSNTVRLH
ncbi:MAG: hypothetical protein P4M12_08310 [Gammaproteobacteria bacterium]|nr:hypothetical protein [Gammaproteobacteria bacterium]